MSSGTTKSIGTAARGLPYPLHLKSRSQRRPTAFAAANRGITAERPERASQTIWATPPQPLLIPSIVTCNDCLLYTSPSPRDRG